MASGGVFLTHNKVLPGAYINFISKARALGTMGERGTVCLPWSGDWGRSDEVVTVSKEDFEKDCLKIFGYTYDADEVKPIREAFLGANCVKFVRIGNGKNASATIGNLVVKAKCFGKRGNNIKITCENQVSGGFLVSTYVDGILADEQSATDISSLIENEFVTFSGEGNLSENAGTNLTGGSENEITGNDYSNFIEKIEAEEFTTLIYSGNDETTKSLFANFTKRLRDDEGYKITCVMHNYNKADFEGVISVINTVNADNENALVYWVGGKNAGCEVNESLTNMLYDGEYSINAKFKKSQLKDFIDKGQFALYGDKDGARVLKDINTFTSFESDKNSDFSNNQIIRVLDAIANDTAKIFNQYYLGKTQNNEMGRSVFKAELIKYHEQLQAIGAIDNFSAEDISVEKGDEKGDVIVSEFVEPISAMDKLYMTCVVE